MILCPKALPTCPNGSEIGAFDCTALQLRAINRHLDATAAQILVSDHNAGGTTVPLDIVQCAVTDRKTRLAELRRELKAASA